MNDLYAALGIGPDATTEDVRRAWRARSKELHPDRGGDAEAFQRAHDAYRVLGDPWSRAAYDSGSLDGGSGWGGDVPGPGVTAGAGRGWPLGPLVTTAMAIALCLLLMVLALGPAVQATVR